MAKGKKAGRQWRDGFNVLPLCCREGILACEASYGFEKHWAMHTAISERLIQTRLDWARREARPGQLVAHWHAREHSSTNATPA